MRTGVKSEYGLLLSSAFTLPLLILIVIIIVLYSRGKCQLFSQAKRKNFYKKRRIRTFFIAAGLFCHPTADIVSRHFYPAGTALAPLESCPLENSLPASWAKKDTLSEIRLFAPRIYSENRHPAFPRGWKFPQADCNSASSSNPWYPKSPRLLPARYYSDKFFPKKNNPEKFRSAHSYRRKHNFPESKAL